MILLNSKPVFLFKPLETNALSAGNTKQERRLQVWKCVRLLKPYPVQEVQRLLAQVYPHTVVNLVGFFIGVVDPVLGGLVHKQYMRLIMG